MSEPDIQAVKERLKSAYVLEVAPHPDDLFLLLQSHDELERKVDEAIDLLTYAWDQFALEGGKDTFRGKSDGCLSCLEDIRAFLDPAEQEGSETCPGCGGDAGDNWFDRSICACGAMHTCCVKCGRALDGCEYEQEGGQDG